MEDRDEIAIRRAGPEDAASLIAFNKAIASETEHIELRHEIISAGIDAILENPSLGFYLVAEHRGEVVGSLMITKEWSDWRNGVFWWVQSVYVSPGLRRKGVYRRLYQYVKEHSKSEPNVCGFRLYVERENEIAQRTYKTLGMTETPYLMFEELDPKTDFLET